MTISQPTAAEESGLSPEDVEETSRRRSAERSRRVALSVVGNMGARIASFAVIVVASRFALADVGPERFGIWMTIASLLTILNLLDFGIGNGLVVPVAARAGRGDREGLQRIVTLGLFATFLIGGAVALLLSITAHWADWAWLFKGASAPALAEAEQALILFALLLGLSLPLQTVHRILAGMQRAYLSHFLSLTCSIAALAVLFLTQSQHLGISEYILFTLGASQLPGLIALGLLVRDGLIRPTTMFDGDRSDFPFLFASSGLFMALQIGALIGWGGDQVLVSALSGPAHAAIYAIGVRIFMMVSIPFTIVNAPLWAVYGEALDRGDKDYVRRTLRLSLLGTVAGALLLSVTVALASPWLWQLFSGGALRYDWLLIASLATWAVIDCSANALAMFLNGAHILKEQLWTVSVFVLVSIPLKAWVIASGGFTTIAFYTSVVYLGTLGLVYVSALRRRMIDVLG